MAHNPHPHGENVIQIHQLDDHIMNQPKFVAKLPDAKRETWMKQHPYPNSQNPQPPTSKKVE